jgi:hypothetical protein
MQGANQAAAAAKLGYPTFFVGQVRTNGSGAHGISSEVVGTPPQVGSDANAGLLRDALERCVVL